MKKTDAAHILEEFFADRDAVSVCVLYGSAAADRLHPHSDIDVAIAGQAPFPSDKLAAWQLELSERFRRETDLIDLNAVNGLILEETLSGLIIKKQDTSVFASLLRKMWYYEADEKPGYMNAVRSKVERFANEERSHSQKA